MLEVLLNMDILKIFRMQEPVSKELLSKTNEIGQYKEVVQEKDVLLKNSRARIKELEEQVAELDAKNIAMEAKIRGSNMDDNEFQELMTKYEDLLKKAHIEKQEMVEENTALKNHTKNLESSFEELLEKYRKAQNALLSFKENEDILMKELEEYREVIETLEEKYDCLKNYSKSKLAEANIEIDNKDKGNIQEVAKLKAKILQSEARINQLEKHVKVEDINSRTSMFAPLKSNIPKI